MGAVTIVTDDLLIFQGQVLKANERHHGEEQWFPKEIIAKSDSDPDFIAVKLICGPAVIEDNEIEEIEPDLFKEGDIVRINVNEIVAIGPSRCCLA